MPPRSGLSDHHSKAQCRSENSERHFARSDDAPTGRNGELPQAEQPEWGRWRDEVFAAMKVLPSADAPPVCDWTVPAGEILDVAVDHADPPSLASTLVRVSLFGAALAGAYYYFM